MIAERATPAAIVRSAKYRRGTIGSATRSSMAKKAAKPSRRDDEGDERRRMRRRGRRSRSPPSTSATNATVKATEPATSKRRLAPGSMCGIANTARANAARPKGMLIQNTQDQPQ